MNMDLKSNYEECEQKMQRSVESWMQSLQAVRTSRANLAIVDPIKVKVYDSIMLLNQIASLSTPDAQTILIEAWDKNNNASIEKAIVQALELTPQNDGNIIRITFPPLTQERREQLIKQIKKQSESVRSSIRNTRRDANEHLKLMKKENILSEDDLVKAKSEIQKLTDSHIKKIDETLEKKEQEILSF